MQPGTTRWRSFVFFVFKRGEHVVLYLVCRCDGVLISRELVLMLFYFFLLRFFDLIRNVEQTKITKLLTTTSFRSKKERNVKFCRTRFIYLKINKQDTLIF